MEPKQQQAAAATPTPTTPVAGAAPAPVAPATTPLTAEHFILPETVVSRVDVARMLRELNEVDEFLRQAALRKGGQPVEMPRPSRLLEETAAANKVNLLQATDRNALLKTLTDLKRTAPTMHMSFASNPSGLFTGKLLLWLRQNISPYMLLQIGLQPELAAGCTVRTISKRYDFSVRKRLENSKSLLTELLQQAKDVAPVAPDPVAMAAGAAPAPEAPQTTQGAP